MNKKINTVQIGKMFEKKAKNILEENEYDIIKENSKINWHSPYDLTVKKEDEIYLVEVRGRRDRGNIFNIKKKKLDRLRKFKRKVIIMCINDVSYKLILLKNFNKELKTIILGNTKLQTILLSNNQYNQIIKKQCSSCDRILKAKSIKQMEYNMRLHKEKCGEINKKVRLQKLKGVEK